MGQETYSHMEKKEELKEVVKPEENLQEVSSKEAENELAKESEIEPEE